MYRHRPAYPGTAAVFFKNTPDAVSGTNGPTCPVQMRQLLGHIEKIWTNPSKKSI